MIIFCFEAPSGQPQKLNIVISVFLNDYMCKVVHVKLQKKACFELQNS